MPRADAAPTSNESPTPDGDLIDLLRQARAEFAEALDDLEHCHGEQRRLEAALDGILANIPLPLAIVDSELRVRAVSAEGERRWELRLDRPLGSSTPEVAAIASRCRRLLVGANEGESGGGGEVTATVIRLAGTDGDNPMALVVGPAVPG